MNDRAKPAVLLTWGYIEDGDFWLETGRGGTPQGVLDAMKSSVSAIFLD